MQYIIYIYIGSDVIYEISSSAFLEFKSKNLIFERFTSNLFHASSLSTDRSLMSAQENAELDVEINEFLLYLSPYFLDGNTFKVLEWLVRKFLIHEMNVDAIMACILPYHETRQFVQVVSILNIGHNTSASASSTASSSSNPWSFLLSVQKSKTLQFFIKMVSCSSRNPKLTTQTLHFSF